MPTPLPARRRFWQRLKLEPDDARNLRSTIVEFASAIAFVGATVFLLWWKFRT